VHDEPGTWAHGLNTPAGIPTSRSACTAKHAQFAGSLHETCQFSVLAGGSPAICSTITITILVKHEANVERYSTLAAQQMFEAGKRRWRGVVAGDSLELLSDFILRGGFWMDIAER